jgi:hypothetical protein
VQSRKVFYIIYGFPTSKSETKSVIDLTQESVHTNDNKDLGDIEAINKDFSSEERIYGYTLLLYSYQ